MNPRKSSDAIRDGVRNAGRVYPLPRPESDSRFTLGLVLDVMGVLERHGYPDAGISGRDVVEMQQTLFRFLYAPSGENRSEVR